MEAILRGRASDHETKLAVQGSREPGFRKLSCTRRCLACRASVWSSARRPGKSPAKCDGSEGTLRPGGIQATSHHAMHRGACSDQGRSRGDRRFELLTLDSAKKPRSEATKPEVAPFAKKHHIGMLTHSEVTFVFARLRTIVEAL